MSNYGVKVSEEGINVLEAMPYQLAYSSEFDTLKVFKRGAGVASVTFPNPTTITIDHGLGYRPAFFFFTEVSSSFGSAGEYFLAPFVYPIGGDVSIVPYVTSSQLKVRYGGDQAPGTTTYNYRYIIFYNRAVPNWSK
ncbi:MAG: hypothetical protein A2Y53_03915 [Chloroflexi bacterium RBG_16_47_49]|nr:MAG: hypothetical protein A2Y53_03915 [Chloroflexi bacterium RBG_16_47_49]